MAFREIWNGPSFLNRSDVVRRMAERDNAGKRYEEHYRKDWDADLWD